MKQYSINQSKILLGYVGQRWERRIVAEIDASIARWAATVPDHRAYLDIYFPSNLG